MRLRPLLIAALLAAACGKVDRPTVDAAGSDHRSDGGDEVIVDAGGPDATPVACDGPEDCANPDDPCLLPGTCENSVCHFEAVDCSHLDTECSRGVCENSECLARPVNEGDPCAGGTMDCGAFSDCGSFADVCDESGTQSRSCTDSACEAGECVTGAAYTDTRTCSRDTDGVTCGSTQRVCDACGYTSDCDESAPNAACVDRTPTCAAAACTGVSEVTAPSRTCSRQTDGNQCTTTGGGTGCCNTTGSCSPLACSQ